MIKFELNKIEGKKGVEIKATIPFKNNGDVAIASCFYHEKDHLDDIVKQELLSALRTEFFRYNFGYYPTKREFNVLLSVKELECEVERLAL